jgi:hypothetical protein
MVKDEVDIIRDWLIYHGSMFGYSNIYVIDNYSTDGTYEILKEYSKKINLKREYDYTKKGVYMTELINKNCKNDIAFPIDVDEFIVYNDNKNIIIDKIFINNYINNLPKFSIYKCNYIHSIITNDFINGYDRATVQCKYGGYVDMKEYSKSFINANLFKGKLDHGNHLPTTDYFLTNICLVHYHCRNLEQMKKKVLNNVLGLGYENNINSLKKQLSINKNCPGNHHINNQINILENNYNLPISNPNENFINLSVFAQRIQNGCF